MHSLTRFASSLKTTCIELNRCTSRQDEALHSKMDTALALDNSGSLRLSKKQRLDDVNVTGEHKLRQAFLRKSLAYDLSGLQLSRCLTQIQGPYTEEEMLQGRPQLRLQKSYQFQVPKTNPKTSPLYLLVSIMTIFRFLLC